MLRSLFLLGALGAASPVRAEDDAVKSARLIQAILNEPNCSKKTALMSQLPSCGQEGLEAVLEWLQRNSRHNLDKTVKWCSSEYIEEALGKFGPDVDGRLMEVLCRTEPGNWEVAKPIRNVLQRHGESAGHARILGGLLSTAAAVPEPGRPAALSQVASWIHDFGGRVALGEEENGLDEVLGVLSSPLHQDLVRGDRDLSFYRDRLRDVAAYRGTVGGSLRRTGRWVGFKAGGERTLRLQVREGEEFALAFPEPEESGLFPSVEQEEGEPESDAKVMRLRSAQIPHHFVALRPGKEVLEIRFRGGVVSGGPDPAEYSLVVDILPAGPEEVCEAHLERLKRSFFDPHFSWALVQRLKEVRVRDRRLIEFLLECGACEALGELTGAALEGSKDISGWKAWWIQRQGEWK